MNEPALLSALPLIRRPRNLALTVVDALGDRIRDGRLGPGAKLASESALMAEFGVSRTVIREALSKLQAAALVQTRHGIGTFVTYGGTDSAVFRIRPDQLETLHDVVAMLELRIGIETEAASLAAQRRSDADLVALRQSLIAFTQALEAGRLRVGPDFQFHLGNHASHRQRALFDPVPEPWRDGDSARPPRSVGRFGRRTPGVPPPCQCRAWLDPRRHREPRQRGGARRHADHLANSRERRRRAAQLAKS